MEAVNVCGIQEPARKAANPEYSIRRMEEKDIDRISALESRNFPQPWSRDSVAFEILENPLGYSLVVEKNNNVIGYVISWYLDDEAHIGTFAVDSEFRRELIGSCLLRKLLNYLKYEGVRIVYLEVRRSNIAAQKLYSKHGFKISGWRKNYYSREKEDALLMSLSF